MRLKRLQLRNVCQIEEADYEFPLGLTAVSGPNGSGKSNSVNVAPYSALTGDYSRHVGGKAGMVRQQADPAERSEIVLTLDNDGEDVILTRGLRCPERSVLQLGKEKITKANEIQERLASALGLSRRLIDNYVFVSQGDLLGFLEASDADRAKAFAHLCDTVKVEEAWELTGKAVQADLLLLGSFDTGAADRIRGLLGQVAGDVREQEQKLQKAKTYLLPEKRVARAQQLVARQQQRAELDTQCRSLRSQAQLTAQAYGKKKPVWQQELKNLLKAQVNLKPYAGLSMDDYTRLERMKQSLRDRDERLELTRQSVSCQRTLDMPTPEGPLEDLDQLYTRRAEAVARSNTLGNVLKALNQPGLVACPTCGTPVTTLQPKLQEFEEESRLCQIEAYDLGLRYTACKAARDAVQQHAQQQRLARDQLTQIEARLKSLPEDTKVTQEVIDNLAEELLAWTAYKQQLIKAQQARTASQTARAELRERFRQQHKSQQEAEKKLKALADEADEAAEAAANLHGHQTAVRDTEVATQLLEVYAQQKQELENRLAAALRQEEEQKYLTRWTQLLPRARDNVLHRSKLPKLVHVMHLQDLEEQVNATLDDFHSPFHVEATEDVSFLAHFSNGTVMPAPGLSGGQKVLLAIAYRLTINSLFAGRIGMMVLDEPTDGLDADNRQLAAEIFERLGRLAESRGQQILVVTHDEALADSCQHRFELQPA